MFKVTKEGAFQLQTPPEQVLFSVRGAHFIKSIYKRTKDPTVEPTVRTPTTTPLKKSNTRRSKSASRRRKAQPPDGKPSIFKAAQALDLDRVRHLLHSKFAKATDRNQYMQTPLHFVVRQSSNHIGKVPIQTKCVKIGALLLQWGANMHAENNVGVSPVSGAAAFSPIMSALFRRYLNQHGDENGWPQDTRTPMEILHDENKMKRVHKKAKHRKFLVKNARTVEYWKNLTGWKNDFHNFERRDPWLLRAPQKTPEKKEKHSHRRTLTKKQKEKRWWSSVDVHLHQAQRAATSNDKVNQWKRELDRRRGLHTLKNKTLESYCGKEIITEKKVRSNRLMRYHQAKILDRSIRKQEAGNYVQDQLLAEQLKHMAPLDLRGYVYRTPTTDDNISNTFVSTQHYNRNTNDKETRGFVKPVINKVKPIGFFTLDTKENIKEAFTVLSNGELTIELPVLMHYLSSMGDPPLDIDELDELRYEISKFALGSHAEASMQGSMKIDYERFVEAMRLLSRQQDAVACEGNAMLKNSPLY